MASIPFKVGISQCGAQSPCRSVDDMMVVLQQPGPLWDEIEFGPLAYSDLLRIDRSLIEHDLALADTDPVQSCIITVDHSEHDQDSYDSVLHDFTPGFRLRCLQLNGTFIYPSRMGSSFSTLTHLELRNYNAPRPVFRLDEFLVAMQSWRAMCHLKLINYLDSVDMEELPHRGSRVHLESLAIFNIQDPANYIRNLLSYIRFSPNTKINVVVECYSFPVDAKHAVFYALPTLPIYADPNVLSLPILTQATELTVDASEALMLTAVGASTITLEVRADRGNNSANRRDLFDSIIHHLPDCFTHSYGHPMLKLTFKGDIGGVALGSWTHTLQGYPNLTRLVAIDTHTGRPRRLFAALLAPAIDQLTPVCFNLDTVEVRGAEYDSYSVEEAAGALEYRMEHKAPVLSLALHLIVRPGGPANLLMARKHMLDALSPFLVLPDEARITVESSP